LLKLLIMRTHGRFEWIRLPEFCLLLILVVSTEMLSAQKNGPFSPRELKKLSVEELMNIEVTSVSKSPEKLTEVASAIQVITNEDIRRSTVTRLPEALSLAPNLQVAQSNSHDWGITARGFNGAPFANNTLADKLLVLIDGRSVYTPLFGGVFWDAQNVLLEDVDRIEVVSGPGGTLWGANAVNGVINIISKNARETQGWYASAAGGSFLRDYAGVRYGGHVDTNFFFRVYGQRFDQNSTTWIDSTESHDAWHMTQGGFRMDYVPGNSNTFSFQGDFYGGMADTGNTIINGQDVLGKWTHRFSENANLSLQVYFDRTWRDLTASDFSEQLSTYDIDLQHHFPIGSNNQVLWGAGYRMMNDEVENSISLTFTPAERRLQLFNGFVQDRIMLVDQELYLTLGTKILHNDYSGFELQPSVRLTCTPSPEHTIWAAVSRAVRTPARFDADETTPFITTRNGEFDSEKVVAYEIGYRIRPVQYISFSIAAFYNEYDDLRSINLNDAPPPALLFANDQQAKSWGLEFSGNAVLTKWWRLRGGYTFLDKRFTAKSPAVFSGSDLFEAIDPHHQALLQSIMDLPGNLQLDITGRYVDMLPGLPSVSPQISAYTTFNARLAWIFREFEFSAAGQNLAGKRHGEFGSREIPRSFYLKGTFRF